MLRELLSGHAQLEMVVAIVVQLLSRNEQLELIVAHLRAGKNRGEQISSAQLDIFLDKLRVASAGEVAAANEKLAAAADDNAGRPNMIKPPRQPPVRKPPPPALRRVDNPIAVPVAERACPVCGGERKCVGHESTDTIELIPAEIIVRQDRREVLACAACDGEMVRAPMGDKVVRGGAYGSRLVANLVIGKYCDGLPLDRQRHQLERLGLSMPSASMSDQVMWATDVLRPIWQGLITAVLGSVVMHIDGTRLDVRDDKTQQKVVTGQLWGCVGDTTHAVYLFTSTGKKNGQIPGEMGPEELLALRRGPIVADAGSTFDKTFQRADVFEVGCNMHGRRYFKKALDAGDARAALAIKAFKSLYDVEATVRDVDDARRLEERQKRSRPVYDELLAWCQLLRPLEPPSSALAKAIAYTLNHRVALTRFIDDGRLPIDNGIVERLHRKPAIGRRNFFLAGSFAGGQRAAIAYSVLASCELAGVNPEEYLGDILPRLTRDGLTLAEVPSMLPSAWKAARDARATDAT